LFFFFKQKPAYEITYGDWSSDVCSSDLCTGGGPGVCTAADLRNPAAQASLLYATGQRVRSPERVSFAAALGKASTIGVESGYGLLDLTKAEIHLVLRTHGPMLAGLLDQQATTFNGGCPPNSCGNLQDVYEDLIEDCKIDAKHSFEDVIMPVAEFKRRYGDRITPLGGLDVDVICRSSADELRAYTRKHIEECFSDGYWALGTGNSLTDYMPVENYMIVLEEGLRVAT